MYPEFKTFKIDFNNRDYFDKALDICEGMMYDVGHGDMILSFDTQSERQFAITLLNNSKIKFNSVY